MSSMLKPNPVLITVWMTHWLWSGLENVDRSFIRWLAKHCWRHTNLAHFVATIWTRSKSQPAILGIQHSDSPISRLLIDGSIFTKTPFGRISSSAALLKYTKSFVDMRAGYTLYAPLYIYWHKRRRSLSECLLTRQRLSFFSRHLDSFMNDDIYNAIEFDSLPTRLSVGKYYRDLLWRDDILVLIVRWVSR